MSIDSNSKIHIIDYVYKEVAVCKEIKCLCGDVYKEHKIDTQTFCKDCDEPLLFDIFSVEQTDDDMTYASGVGYCKKCNGVSIKDYGNKEFILDEFKKGKKVAKYFTY